mmetsp:Transcript_27285/g.58776  ORF Transcript_27285/g.58776 Transcript_27285/m.58776 type:complete len:302 (-) Transcript_27285:378-1283(-)
MTRWSPLGHPPLETRRQPRPPVLLELPSELLSIIAAQLDAYSLLALASVSCELNAASANPHVWSTLLHRQYRKILDALFDSQAPQPSAGCAWKTHYFRFSSRWKKLAMARSGRMLLVISSAEAAPQPVSWSGCDWHVYDEADQEIADLTDSPRTFGVYDVTDFARRHPGADELLLKAAEERDASSLFAITGHSNEARKILQALVVPGLEELPFDDDIGRAKRRCHVRPQHGLRSALGASIAVVLIFGAVLIHWCEAVSEACWCTVLAAFVLNGVLKWYDSYDLPTSTDVLADALPGARTLR